MVPPKRTWELKEGGGWLHFKVTWAWSFKCVAHPARRASSPRGHPTLGIISFTLTFATVAVASGAPVSAQGRLQS